VPLQEWQAPPSGPDESLFHPSGQAAVRFDPGWWRDIKSLFLVILVVATIGGAMYEWITHQQPGDQPRNIPKNAPKVAPASKPSPLYPWCPPERDECWR
jgi:hypothetical protein